MAGHVTIEFGPVTKLEKGIYAVEATFRSGTPVMAAGPKVADGAVTAVADHLFKQLKILGFTQIDLKRPHVQVNRHLDGFGLTVKFGVRASGSILTIDTTAPKPVVLQ